MNKFKAYRVLLFLLFFSACTTTTNTPVYKDDWKGQHVNQFVEKWTNNGYQCRKRQERAFDTGNVLGMAECYTYSKALFCPKTIRRGVVYDLDTNAILGKSSYYVDEKCF
ncbi:hypothetical protein AB8Q18_07675 [Neisseriaceae bacterium CLB008]